MASTALKIRQPAGSASWKGASAGASPQDVRAMVEDSNGVLWLVSGTLQRFDPATGRFTAYSFDSLRTGKARRDPSPALVKVGKRIAEDSFLAIDRSGVLWVATTNGLLRFDRDCDEFTIHDEAMVCRPVLSTVSSKIAAEICG